MIPEDIFDPFKFVKLAPETVGSVAGKRASGMVPVANFVALVFPSKVVAVTMPADIVIAVPILTSTNVEIPLKALTLPVRFPVTLPVTSPVRSPVTSPVTSPVKLPFTLPVTFVTETVTTPTDAGDTDILDPKLIVPPVPTGLPSSCITKPVPEAITPVNPPPSPTNDAAVTVLLTLTSLAVKDPTVVIPPTSTF